MRGDFYKGIRSDIAKGICSNPRAILDKAAEIDRMYGGYFSLPIH